MQGSVREIAGVDADKIHSRIVVARVHYDSPIVAIPERHGALVFCKALRLRVGTDCLVRDHEAEGALARSEWFDIEAGGRLSGNGLRW